MLTEFMVWLYVTGLVFLIGSEINAEVERAATPGHVTCSPEAARD